jgi:hypothetical protein
VYEGFDGIVLAEEEGARLISLQFEPVSMPTRGGMSRTDIGRWVIIWPTQLLSNHHDRDWTLQGCGDHSSKILARMIRDHVSEVTNVKNIQIIS